MLLTIECRLCLWTELETTYWIQCSIQFYHYHLYFTDECQKDKISADVHSEVGLCGNKAHALCYPHVSPSGLTIKIPGSLAPLQPAESEPSRDRPGNLYFT